MSLTGRQREFIAGQVLTLVEQVYVHRQLKTALYGVDASALLHGLRSRAAGMTDAEFHEEMREIVKQIRDRHCSYRGGLGPDYLLPFRVEQAWDGEIPVYLVTASKNAEIEIGSRVLRWNDIPIDAVIRELAEDMRAGNHASRNAIALVLLTRRLAWAVNPPDETIVRLDLLRPDGSARQVRIGWSVSPQPMMKLTGPRQIGPAKNLGLDIDLLTSNRWVFENLYPQKFKRLSAQRYSNVEARTVRDGETDFGYLRIYDFAVEDTDDFADYVAGLLKSMPPAGILIDLRDNPGGIIPSGEALLQLFTNDEIEPLGFRFRASDATKYMSDLDPNFWTPTIDQGTRLNAEYTATFPLTAANTIGRMYPGPSILIVNALTYSTADMFTAGFHDHAIGPVICTAENIGAGGANNWPHWVLRVNFPGFVVPIAGEIELNSGTLGPILSEAFASNGQPLAEEAKVTTLEPDWTLRWQIVSAYRHYLVRKRDWLPDLAVYFDGDNRFIGDLPDGVDFGLSVRQAIRKNGLVLEDEGIEPDHYYRMTKNDLLLGNVDLIAFACKLLQRSESSLSMQ